MRRRDTFVPPLEIGRGVLFTAFWAVMVVLALPQLVLFGLWRLPGRARRLVTLPLVLTVVGLAVIGLAGRPVAAAEACGEASWYGGAHHGRLTASGAVFDQWAMTAAHRTLPFGTMVRVTLGDRSVTVEITDRGPAAWTGRIIDLSRGAAERLGMIQRGVAPVCISW